MRKYPRWRTIASIVLIAALATSCSEDEPAVDRKQCQRFRDHLVDLRLATVTDPGVDVAQHRAAMMAALGTDFINDCQKLSPGELRCGLAAKDLQSASACASSH